MKLVLCGAALLALVGAACGGSSDSSSDDSAAPTTEAPPVTEAAVETNAPVAETAPPETTPPETTPAETTTTTTVPEPAFTLSEPDADGIIAVNVNPSGLSPLFNSLIDGGDPYYHVHTQQDDLFIGIEMYSVYGDGWTGELGTFPADCTTHGICVYFDPDGTGAMGSSEPGTGTVTVVQIDGETIVTLDDVLFEGADGTLYRITDLTLGG